MYATGVVQILDTCSTVDNVDRGLRVGVVFLGDLAPIHRVRPLILVVVARQHLQLQRHGHELTTRSRVIIPE